VSKTLPPVVLGGATYTVTETANWADAAGSVNPCGLSGPTPALANKSVDVQVSWSSRSNFGKTAPVRMTALISPGSDSSDPNSGIIFVGVTGASGAGSANVTVNIAVNSAAPAGAKALTSQPAVTTSTGCSVARGVAPGNYIVTITRANGIDATQVTSPTRSVTVTAGGSTTASFQYDTASKIVPTIATNGAVVPDNLGLTYRSAAGDFPVSSTGAVSLFPFTDGYRVIGGSYVGSPASIACTDPDPSKWTKSSDNKVGVPVPTAVTTPGNIVSGNGSPPWLTGTTSVPLGTFTADFGIAPVAYVTATPTNPLDPGDPGCYTSPATAYTFPLTATKKTFALPYGTYTITARAAVLGLPIAVNLSSANGSRVTVNGSTIMLDPRTASS
jgi:hypothetical protein